MPFLETPTTFYLGRKYDPNARRVTGDAAYYASRDLLTHAVIVGMTGSGKTGLGITLVEEAVLDNIPIIAIDPKGDITNLLLTFPQLRPEDFAPWINPDEARRAGVEPAAYAQTVAGQWRKELASWDIVPGRMAAMMRAAQFSIYTPGSDSGLSLRVLDSLRAPKEGWGGAEEMHRERINALTTALLALIGKEVEPVRDREHVLVANIIERAWQNGQDLTLEDLIRQIQNPPFQTLGVFEIDKFFPPKERGKLAVALNQIIASPSFQSWLRGDPLDADKLLHDANGRPRVSIIYVAHLSDSERLFVVTLILDALLTWMRSLSGTSTPRALVYFDELFGFFPPAPRNPPTKEPLLRLLKQARAFGIGMILATQNPVDLDYKGLSNAGTWFLGKLQTDNDKARVLSGLQTVATAEAPIDLKQIDHMLSNLGPRTFIVNNIHDPQTPSLMFTRWTMSYLHGPITRPQITQLMAAQRQERAAEAAQVAQAAKPVPPVQPVFTATPLGAPPPTLPEVKHNPILTATPPPAPLPPPISVPEAPLHPEQFGAKIIRSTQQMTAVPAAVQVPGNTAQPPVTPDNVEVFFVPPGLNLQDAAQLWSQRTGTAITTLGAAALVYRPALLGQVSIRFLDRKTHVEEQQTLAYRVPDPGKTGLVRWTDYRIAPMPPEQLTSAPVTPALFAPLTPGLSDSKRLSALKSDLPDYVYRSVTLPLHHHPGLKVVSKPGESQSSFLARLQAAASSQGQPPDADQWAKITGEIEEVTLSPYKKDIALDHFGIVWLPGWQTTINGQVVAFAAYSTVVPAPSNQAG